MQAMHLASIRAPSVLLSRCARLAREVSTIPPARSRHATNLLNASPQIRELSVARRLGSFSGISASALQSSFIGTTVPSNSSFAISARGLAAVAAVKAGGAGLPTPALSAASSQAIKTIKETVQKTQKKSIHLSKAQKRTLQGNLRKYKLMGGRPEFHNVDLNRHGRIFEPWHTFEIVISSSKNNCWMTVKNKGRQYRTVFSSHAGNVGFRKATRKTEQATYRIAQNVARKLKRLGVGCAEVTFRKVMKIETCLQAFSAHGLTITRLTHQPRIPKGKQAKPRKQRRV